MPEGLIALYLFPVTLIISLIGCLAGTLLTAPTDSQTIETFYTTVKPWGFWNPVFKSVKSKQPDFTKNTRFLKDMGNVAIGIIVQTCLVAMPIFIIIRNWQSLFITISIIAIGAIILKYTWWDKLHEI
jgi:hypothetical protein